jgi:hypothetical protein
MPASELAEIFQVTAEDGSPLDAAPVTVALLERRPVTQRVRFRSLDGIWRLVDVAAFPIEGQGGRQLGAVGFFWEVQS